MVGRFCLILFLSTVVGCEFTHTFDKPAKVTATSTAPLSRKEINVGYFVQMVAKKQEGTKDLVYIGKSGKGYEQYMRKTDRTLFYMVPAAEKEETPTVTAVPAIAQPKEVVVAEKPVESQPKEVAVAEKPAEPQPKEVAVAEKPAEPQPKEVAVAEKPVEPQPKEVEVKPEEKAIPPAEAKKKYFWHGAYHATQHPNDCQEIYWHPYILTQRSNPYIAATVEKFKIIETGEGYMEEVDVSAYPKQHQHTYKQIIRVRCNQCHSPARYFNRRFVPAQWQAALTRVLALGMIPPETKEWKEVLLEFFVYYEQQRLAKGEEEEE